MIIDILLLIASIIVLIMFFVLPVLFFISFLDDIHNEISWNDEK